MFCFVQGAFSFVVKLFAFCCIYCGGWVGVGGAVDVQWALRTLINLLGWTSARFQSACLHLNGFWWKENYSRGLVCDKCENHCTNTVRVNEGQAARWILSPVESTARGGNTMKALKSWHFFLQKEMNIFCTLLRHIGKLTIDTRAVILSTTHHDSHRTRSSF